MRDELGDMLVVKVPIGSSLRAIEEAAITVMLERCGGNITATARALRIDRRTLYRKRARTAS